MSTKYDAEKAAEEADKKRDKITCPMKNGKRCTPTCEAYYKSYAKYMGREVVSEDGPTPVTKDWVTVIGHCTSYAIHGPQLKEV